jgi:hypothetical protein
MIVLIMPPSRITGLALSEYLRGGRLILPHVGRCPGRFVAAVAEALLQQLTMFVTAEGKRVLPDSEEFLASLGDPDPDYDAGGFAVRNLGFVKFQVLDRLVTEIELHPRNVDVRALHALEGLLAEAGTKLFRIKYLEDSWRSEISSSAEHTMVRLRELCAPVLQLAANERFHIEPQDPSVLFDTQTGRAEALGRMAIKWRVAFGNFDPSVMGLVSHTGLLPLFTIVGFEPRETRPILRFFGEAHRWAGDGYRVNGIGHPVEAMPDKEYGNWLAQFYDSVATKGQPRYDLVTAQMEYQGEAGKPRRAVRYERLLLPWRTPAGEVLVTSCSKLKPAEPAANLRISGSDSSASIKVPKSS